MTRLASLNSLVMIAGLMMTGSLGVSVARAHCDTLDGPVVSDARAALDTGDVTPVLKWVDEDRAAEIRQAFAKTLAVRTLSAEARELADVYFFETLVRIHRAGEGAPYTGLKPAGAALEPGVAESDAALNSGNADELVRQATTAVAEGIHERFARASETRKHADDSVAAGREYVRAYVTFVHYVERIFADARADADHHAAGRAAGESHDSQTESAESRAAGPELREHSSVDVPAERPDDGTLPARGPAHDGASTSE